MFVNGLTHSPILPRVFIKTIQTRRSKIIFDNNLCWPAEARRGHRGGAYSLFCKALMPIYLSVKENEITEVALIVLFCKALMPFYFNFSNISNTMMESQRWHLQTFIVKHLCHLLLFFITICKYLDSKPLTISFLKLFKSCETYKSFMHR